MCVVLCVAGCACCWVCVLLCVNAVNAAGTATASPTTCIRPLTCAHELSKTNNWSRMLTRVFPSNAAGAADRTGTGINTDSAAGEKGRATSAFVPLPSPPSTPPRSENILISAANFGTNFLVSAAGAALGALTLGAFGTSSAQSPSQEKEQQGQSLVSASSLSFQVCVYVYL